MLPQGFFGTRADLLMDVVVASLAAILPILVFSWLKARRGQWATHKRTQVILGSTLGVVVVLFEADLRIAGGIFELTKQSAYAGTALLNGSIWFHVALSIATAILWLALIIVSLRRFANPPKPGPFPSHRRWGQAGMILMALTGLTGIELYVLGFVY